jgi:hypothetical protein
MANKNEGRVLQRMGARELKQEEVTKVIGAAITLLSVIITNTSSGGFDEHHDS